MPAERKTVIIEPEGPNEWYRPLEDYGSVEFFCPEGPIGPGLVREVARGADAVVITSSCGLSADDMDALPSLKIIAKCGGKPSSVDIDAATARGVAVTYVPEANSSTVAEFTVMLMLDCLRRFPFISSSIGKGLNRNTTDMFGKELRDKTVGIIGFGAIGREVSRRLAGFDCRMEIFDPFYKPRGSEPEHLSFRGRIEDLLPEVDILSLHCTLNGSTREMIGDRELGMMKHSAGIINTARAQLIDDKALERALKERRLAFAALDVFTVEPPGPDHPLLGLENVILTPHLASWTPEALFREVRGAVDSVVALFRGEDIPGLINPEFRGFQSGR